MKRPLGGTREAAEIVAVQALTFIAEQPDQLERFLNATGIDATQIRAAARERGFLAGVLEHMLSDESLLIAFASSAGIDPAEVARARGAFDNKRDRHGP
jgi:Protein of unknown function (DUF3572)